MRASLQLNRNFRRHFALLMAAALLWSVGAEASSDWVEHKRSYAAAVGVESAGDHSPPGSPAEHDKSCHACHHLQAHLAPAALVPETVAALPRAAAHAITRDEGAPDLPYHPLAPHSWPSRAS